MPELNIKLVIDGKEANATLNLTKEQLAEIASVASKAGQTTTSSLSSIGGIVTGLNQGLELANKAFDVLSKPLQAAGQFEQYETSLKVMLGSTEKAKERLAELVEFAKTTPFELPQVVEAANQLQAIGRYSQENLTMLGDLASASGKPMEQALSAYSKLMTGQKGVAIDMFRDLLISADDWSKATGAKIGANGELQASVEQMAEALPKILKEKGFDGMMQAQSETLLGMTSNFSDAVGQLTTEIGDLMMPVAKDILTLLTPAVGAAKDNVSLLIGAVETGVATFITYQIAVNGVTVATKVWEAATINVKKAYEALKVAMATNPMGIAITLAAGLAAALYKLNEAYGNTLENQLENAKAAEEANKQSQKNTEKKIEEKEAVRKLGEEYESLTKKLNSGSLSAEERKKAETRLHEILTKLKEQYPDLIKSTGDYSKELDNVKESARLAKGEISELNNELTKYQKDMVKLKIATGNVEVSQGFEDIYKEFRTLTIGGSKGLVIGDAEGEKQVKYYVSLANDLSSGKKKISQVVKELGDELSRYSDAAAKGGDNAAYNLEKANNINTLIVKLQELKKNYDLLNAGKGIDAVQEDGSKKNSTSTTADKKDPLKEAIANEIEDIKKRNEKIELEQKAHAKSLIDIEKDLLKEKENLKGIEDKILHGPKTKEEFERLKFERDLSQQRIAIIENEVKKKQDAEKKLFEESQKSRGKRFDSESKAEKEENELYKESQKNRGERYRENREYDEKEKQTKQETAQANIEAGMQQYDAEKSLAENLKEITRQRIMAILSEAVMTQIAKVIATVPWPLNLILAPAAGLALQGLLEGLIPKFEQGGLVDGPEKVIKINERGPEFVMNHEATKRNLSLLEAMNAGQDPVNVLQGAYASKMAIEGSIMRNNFLMNNPAVNIAPMVNEMQDLKKTLKDFAAQKTIAYIGDREFRKAYYKAQLYTDTARL